MTLASAFDNSKAFQGGSMRARILVIGVAIALFAAACGNAGSDKKTSSTIPKGGGGPVSIDPESLKKHLPVTAKGVTDTEIHLAAVLTQTNNPTGGDWSVLADGINAYFRMVNDTGGL